MTGSQEHDNLERIVQEIVELSKKIPNSVAEATKDDRIYDVMTNIDGESAWATFNRRFDILFGEDCRDENGRLHHVRRGRHGMNKVTSYLTRIIVNENSLKGFYAPAAVKLNRLKAELEILCSNSLGLPQEIPASNQLPAARAVPERQQFGRLARQESNGWRSWTCATGILDRRKPKKKTATTTGSAQLLSKETIQDDPRDKTYKGGAARAKSIDSIPEYSVDADGHEVVLSDADEQPVTSSAKRKFVLDESESSEAPALSSDSVIRL
ncbi:uncharacterized protein B0H18DRAFT_1127717 [Fomitopsis serialis]|uniref:uncharacterized protein n=1 Tax=Fomitopsis serialis TaxID=139415 RepID=UPI002007385D|nr:uncharacterized protein B0H18DRAFT_1127717 [Neoantrodia serialis]KAH9912013.1 hypothetical protein B0H18DRAFT_1127717 [Neoantrodia serialis]